MTSETLHDDEIPMSEDLARRLIAEQLPAWSGEQLRPVSVGTDAVLYRLGPHHVVRFPRALGAADQMRRDAHWLPLLADHLSLPVPRPVAVGEPGSDYPLPWAVYEWLDGAMAVDAMPTDLNVAADTLAAFVRAMRAVPVEGGPVAVLGQRGAPLAGRDDEVRGALAGLRTLDEPFDVDRLTELWATACAVPNWAGSPVWLHGDLHNGNILVRDGVVSGVIDFGCLAMGDPSPDLLPAWTLLEPESRERFRAQVDVDDDTWERGKGWAVFLGAVIIPYYIESSPLLLSIARRALTQVLLDG